MTDMAVPPLKTLRIFVGRANSRAEYLARCRTYCLEVLKLYGKRARVQYLRCNPDVCLDCFDQHRGTPYGAMVALKDEGGTISYGYSMCHPDDQWNRHEGLARAFSKALEDGVYNFETAPWSIRDEMDLFEQACTDRWLKEA
ncbi:MAG: hypothetical protein ACXABY_00760 [Candidatus Thorarchaeota archaeon]